MNNNKKIKLTVGLVVGIPLVVGAAATVATTVVGMKVRQISKEQWLEMYGVREDLYEASPYSFDKEDIKAVYIDGQPYPINSVDKIHYQGQATGKDYYYTRLNGDDDMSITVPSVNLIELIDKLGPNGVKYYRKNKDIAIHLVGNIDSESKEVAVSYIFNEFNYLTQKTYIEDGVTYTITFEYLKEAHLINNFSLNYDETLSIYFAGQNCAKDQEYAITINPTTDHPVNCFYVSDAGTNVGLLQPTVTGATNWTWDDNEKVLKGDSVSSGEIKITFKLNLQDELYHLLRFESKNK